MPTAERAPAIETMLRDVGLGEKIDSRVLGFSGGQKRKLSLAMALLGDPRFLFLGERSLLVSVLIC